MASILMLNLQVFAIAIFICCNFVPTTYVNATTLDLSSAMKESQKSGSNLKSTVQSKSEMEQTM